jgi:hypothetical protein
LLATPEPASDWVPVLITLAVIPILAFALAVFLLGRRRRKEGSEDEE